MKKHIWVVVVMLLGVNFTFGQTNDFYDDAETIQLGIPEIEISGEITGPVKVDFTKLELHSVIVKETRVTDWKEHFIGAYRYDGYSLLDILNNLELKKNSADVFPPQTDLYIEVVTTRGEKTVFSWGEIFYPTHLHEIIVATQVARIVPTKSKNQWPLPTVHKLVVGSDLLTERNLDSPAKIIVKSYSRQYTITKGMHPMFAPSISVNKAEQKLAEIGKLPKNLVDYIYPNIFYGRGMGIHKTTPFQGKLLKDVLKPNIDLSPEQFKTGFLAIGGKDGYHALFSVSEVFNRNDQTEVMIYTDGNKEDGGKFKVFVAADFFSDRAVKSVETIYFESVR
jgi:hypothetical protein